MKTPKQILDKIIIGMSDDDRMKYFIIMAMEEYAKEYHEMQLKKLRVADVSGRFCECRLPHCKTKTVYICEKCDKPQNC